MPTKNNKKSVFRRAEMHKHKREKSRDKKEHSPYISTFLGVGLAVMLLFVGIGVANADTDADTQLFYEGARFPSPHLAPISTPYLIFWYGDGYYEPTVMQPHATVVDAHDFPETRYWAWADIGVLPLERTLSPRYGKEEPMYVEYKAAADKGFYGMSVDELAPDEDTSVQNAINAIRRVKQDYPDFYVQAWYFSTPYWGGMTDAIASGQDVVNLYISEAYIRSGEDPEDMHKITDRINELKSYGLEGKAIMGLATAWTEGHGTPSQIANQIKYIRTLSPQIASNGIAFYEMKTSTAWPLRADYDAVVNENFFEPSPTAEITSLHNGDTVSGAVTISVIDTPNSGTKSPIVSYRYFIDNECVRISPDSEYLWNTAGYSEGSHIITVHAVAGDYLAGVSQIEVIVGEAATGTISGTVTDKDTGNPIEGATISANSYSNTTNSTGGYTLTNVRVGNYTVTASATGYQSQSQENVEVIEKETTTVDFWLTEDNTPPIISNVTGITGSSAIITWTTDEPATSQVEYGLDTGYGSNSTLDTKLVTNHSVILTGSNTTYHYRVKSRDEAGNNATSGDYNFTTTEETNLAGLWHFDEGSGTNASDSSGNNNHGTLTNMDPATDWVDGKIGNALDFDGSNNYVDCGQGASLNITDAITIVAWVKPHDVTSSRQIVAKFKWMGSSYAGYWLDFGDGDVRFRIGDGTTNTLINKPISVDEWSHVVGTYTSTGSNNFKVYVNGVAKTTTTSVTISIPDISLFIGCRYGTDGWFNGTIDEVRIYNRALSEEEIKADYEAGLEDITPPETTITSGPNGTINYNDVSFNWTGSDDVTPTSQLVYSYKLEGYDNSWSFWTSNTSKSYNDLPNDDYTFKVKAKDKAGKEDPTSAERSFTVLVDSMYPRYDVNEEGKVDVLDTTIVGQHFGETTNSSYPRYDVNGDGKVDILDTTIVGQHFGEITS